jgi:hypothetical protein
MFSQIPKLNPLMGIPLFTDVQEILSQYLISGSLSGVECSLIQLLENHNKRIVQGLHLDKYALN